MSGLIRLFTEDLTSLLFPNERIDPSHGFSTDSFESHMDAWANDMQNIASDAHIAFEKVSNGKAKTE